MPISNLKTNIILLLTAISISICCVSCGCSACDGPCAGGGITCDDYSGKYYGSSSLSDSNKIWLSFADSASRISLKNAQGFEVSYDVYHHYGSYVVPVNARYSKGEERPCCAEKTIYYQDYYNTQTENVDFNPRDGALPIKIERASTIQYQLNSSDSLIVTSNNEYLYLVFNSRYYPIRIDTSYRDSTQLFHSSIQLHNQTFTNVYELIDVSAALPTIKPKGIYYSFTKGIVGYYLTNNELWAQE